MTMIDRINKRMDELGLNQSQLAKRMGKEQRVIWTLLSGRTKTYRDMPALADALETTTEWLLTGKTASESVNERTPNYKNLRDALIKAIFSGKGEEAEAHYTKLLDTYIDDFRTSAGHDPSAEQTLGYLQGLRAALNGADKEGKK